MHLQSECSESRVRSGSPFVSPGRAHLHLAPPATAMTHVRLPPATTPRLIFYLYCIYRSGALSGADERRRAALQM